MFKILFLILLKKTLMTSIFITHGGGPMPILQRENHQIMYKQFAEINNRFPNPKAIIIFSAHWEQAEWTIIDFDHPPLYYDYGGFPPQSYNLSYRMSSNSDVRNYIKESLLKEGVKLKTNTKRGYDHGVFIPLMIMYPEIKVPVVQISILESLDPEDHFKMGVALRTLKNQGFLIIGSGASVHGGFGQKSTIPLSKQFDDQLTRQINEGSTEDQMLKIVKNWRKLPYSSVLHPRQEHLVPLFINLGLFEGKKRQSMKLFLMGVHLSTFLID